MLFDAGGGNAIATVWACVIRVNVPTAQLATVIDDRRMYDTGEDSVAEFAEVVARTCAVDMCTGTVTNLKKTSCAKEGRKQAMKGVARSFGIKHATIEVQVGYQIAFQKKVRPCRDKMNGAEKATKTAQSVGKLPPLLARSQKDQLLCATAAASTGMALIFADKESEYKFQTGGDDGTRWSEEHAEVEAVVHGVLDQGTQPRPTAGLDGADFKLATPDQTRVDKFVVESVEDYQQKDGHDGHERPGSELNPRYREHAREMGRPLDMHAAEMWPSSLDRRRGRGVGPPRAKTRSALCRASLDGRVCDRLLRTCADEANL